MQTRYLFFLLLFISWQCCDDCIAQNKIFNAVITQSRDGKITSMAQDAQGYIWFGTGSLGAGSGSGGIHKYDGQQVISYRNDPKDSNSLANNVVECLYIDSTGIIWIGTIGSGLDRFDPVTNTFTHFRHDPANSSTLSNDSIQCILEDDPDHIWLGTRVGLNLFEKRTGKCRHFLSNPGNASTIASNDVRILYKDHEGTLWIGCGSPRTGEDAKEDDGGLNRFDRATGKFTRYRHDPHNPNSIANNKVRAIFEDSKGNFWIGTAGDGLHTLNRTTGNFTHDYYDPGHPEKLSRPLFDSSVPYDFISFITEDAAGAIWIGTCRQGLNKYDPVTKKITHYGISQTASHVTQDTTSGLDYDWLWNVFFSKDGLMWICGLGGDIINADIKTVIPYYHAPTVNSFYFEQESNSLWIGTSQGLIRRNLTTHKDKIWRHDPLDPNSISNNMASTVRADAEGKLWIATTEGLDKFDPLTNTFTSYWPDTKKQNSFANNINNLFIDHRKNIWLATVDGVYVLDPKTGLFTNHFYNSNDSNSLSNNDVLCITEYPNNTVWLGTVNGLNKLDNKTGKYQRYLAGLLIKNIFADASGVIWAATIDGLFRYSGASKEFTRFVDINARTEISEVLHVMEDNSDNLWVTTSNNLVKINKSRDTVKIYGENYGVHFNNEYFMDNLKATNGELFFGDQSGYYAFFPDQLKDNDNFQQVSFTDFKLGDEDINPVTGGILTKPIWNTKEIRLNYKQNVFSFEFNGIDYKNTRQPKYLFMLGNYDDNWRPVGADRRAYLFNIPPGKYIFRVRAVNANGIWGEKQIAIIITPPWYKTWWAYTIYGICFLSIAFLANRIIKNRIIERERMKSREKEIAQAREIEKAYNELKFTQAQLIESEKQKFEARHQTELLELEAQALRAQMNPHFIFNCINSIKLLVQKNEQEKAIHYLITFSKLLRTIFENAAKREITLFDEIEICRLYIQLESLRFSDRFNYQFNIDGTIDLKSITIPALIMQPFIENAIWHGIMPKEETGDVTLSVNKQNNLIYCIIEDDGIGIEMSKQNKSANELMAHHSKGMHLTQNRLDLDNLLHHRNIGVEIINKRNLSGQPAGTVVILTLNEY